MSASVPDHRHGSVVPFLSVRFDSSSQSPSEEMPEERCQDQHKKQTERQLRRRRDELEEQLSSVDDEEPDSTVIGLRRELEAMRALILELQNAGFDEPPPSYVSEGDGPNFSVPADVDARTGWTTPETARKEGQ